MTLRIPYPRGLALCLLMLMLSALSVFAASPGAVEMLSVTSAEQQPFVGAGASGGTIDISPNNRFVVFASTARLNAADLQRSDIYMRDRTVGSTQLVSVGNAPAAGGAKVLSNGDSFLPSVSDDGRFVAYQSAATNLVAADGNTQVDVFVRDMRGNNVRASLTDAGAEVDGASQYPQISGNGQTIAFESDATNLVGGDTNGSTDVFVRRLPAVAGAPGTTQRVSVNDLAQQTPDGARSRFPSISRDGNLVAFQSTADNLVPNDQGGFTDIFLKNLSTGVVEMISVNDDDDQGDGDSTLPYISGDGQFVAFVSAATNLAGPGVDTNDFQDIYLRDRAAGTTTRVSVATGGGETDADSGLSQTAVLPAGPVSGRPSLSDDGQLVAFVSDATNLVPNGGDTNDIDDIFVHDTLDGSTERLNVSNGVEGNATAAFSNRFATMSPDGTFVGFDSTSSNLVPNDFQAFSDVFLVTVNTVNPLNSPPVADAGEDQTVFELENVVLDASDSDDVDGDPLTFRWRQIVSPGDPVVTLLNADTDMASFDALALGDDPIQLEFEVSVSDGVNPPVTDRVFVDVQPALAEVRGTVVDLDGNPVEGAEVRVIRDDGVSSTLFVTDFTGEFVIVDVHAGLDVLVASAPGFESAVVDLGFIGEGEVLELDIDAVVLSLPTAELAGVILLSDDSPLIAGTVELLDGQNQVVTDLQGNPLSTTTDSAGEYLISNIDSLAISRIVSLRISAKSQGLIPWNVAAPLIFPGELNVLDFQYGSLRVSLTGSNASVRRKLDGTSIDVMQGNIVLATNIANNGVRTFIFPNVPATGLRVRGTNVPQRLTGQIVPVTVAPGSTSTQVTIRMRPFGIF